MSLVIFKARRGGLSTMNMSAQHIEAAYGLPERLGLTRAPCKYVPPEPWRKKRGRK